MRTLGRTPWYLVCVRPCGRCAGLALPISARGRLARLPSQPTRRNEDQGHTTRSRVRARSCHLPPRRQCSRCTRRDRGSGARVGCISPIVRWRAAIWGSPVTDRRLLGRVRTGSVLASVSEASSTRIRAPPAPRSNLCTPQGQGSTPRASGCPRLRREGVPAEASPSAVRGSWRSRPRPGISRPPMGDRTVRERDRATLTQRCIGRAICAPDFAPLTGPGLTT